MRILIAIVIVLTATGCQTASAENAPTYRSRYKPAYTYNHQEWRQHYGRRYVHRHADEHEGRRHYDEPVRYGKVIREESLRRYDEPEHEEFESRYRGDRCRDTLAIVGDQYASEQGAQQEADKAWMQTARWQHGERYMSRENAANPSYECGRSSVGSVVGQVFFRCRLKARPCPPEEKRQ